nr:hypothetical protein [Tanacetum cinerariifolium]
MDQDSAHIVVASKVPMLKPGEFEIWRIKIEQYIQMIDYPLWEVIENGATLPQTQVVEGVRTVMPITSVEDKAQRRLEVMDLKWQMAMITMRAKRFWKKTERKLTINGNETIGFDKSNVECYNYHKRENFARECRALINQDTKHKESTRRSVPIETPAFIALVSCDGSYEHYNSVEAGVDLLEPSRRPPPAGHHHHHRKTFSELESGFDSTNFVLQGGVYGRSFSWFRMCLLCLDASHSSDDLSTSGLHQFTVIMFMLAWMRNHLGPFTSDWYSAALLNFGGVIDWYQSTGYRELGSCLSKGLLLLRVIEEKVGDELKWRVLSSIYSVLTFKGQENLEIKVRKDRGDVERLWSDNDGLWC